MDYEHLMFERHGAVAVVTLSRPEKLNALNAGLQDETRAACAEIEADDDLRVAIFTGAGRGFCAGADLTSGRAPSGDDLPPQPERLDEYGWVGRQALALYGMTKPTIAAVNGVAVGAGMSFALACDLRIGSELTRFKTVFLERSLSPDSGMSFFLPRIVGYSRAVDLIMTSRNVGGEEAYRLGLLDRFVASDRLLDEALAVANEMAFWPPMAVRSAKRVIQRNLQHDLETALREEYNGLSYARRAPHDVSESIASFREQRTPNFTGT
ncbi:MAG: enoyl-CoA hydratase/isomerase family protein [Chloroflexi bacterium]|nr:enoyl-CoA hydratase/isomerase family protein [Chloroflexota bacterium]